MKPYILAIILALPLLSACENYSSSVGVLSTAGSALKDNKPDLFFKTLTGDAKAQYGNLAGFATLKSQTVDKYPKYDLGEAKLLSENPKFREYRVAALANGKAFVTARTVCELSEQENCTDTGNDSTCWEDAHGHEHCTHPHPIQHCTTRTVEYCLISNLEF